MPLFKRYAAPLAAAVLIASPAVGQNTTPSKAPTSVTINQIEENPAAYKGQTIKVSGEVQEVLGPRMFTIDENEWIDLDGETLVLVPAPLAALVNDDTAVTVTGTVRTMVKAELQREWGWFDMGPEIEAEFSKRPVIVADSITNTHNGVALTVKIDPSGMAEQPRTSGSGDKGMAKITDLASLAKSHDERMVGRRVEVKNAVVETTAKDGGFWVTAGTERLFVLPDSTSAMKVTPGQTVAVNGVVLAIPDGMRSRLGDRMMVEGEAIYLYASHVKDINATR